MGIKIACALKYATGRGQRRRGSGQIAERALACQQLEMEGTDAPAEEQQKKVGSRWRGSKEEKQGGEGHLTFASLRAELTHYAQLQCV